MYFGNGVLRNEFDWANPAMTIIPDPSIKPAV